MLRPPPAKLVNAIIYDRHSSDSRQTKKKVLNFKAFEKKRDRRVPRHARLLIGQW